MSDELSSESFTAICTQCGKVFEPTPDEFVEVTWQPELVGDDEETEDPTPEELKAMQPWDLKAIGLTPEMRDALLKGETVTTAQCICMPCMDAMAAEQGDDHTP